MPFLSTLDSTQLNKLRGTGGIPPTFSCQQYVIFAQGEIVFQALVNGTPTGTSFAQLTFDTVTVGAYTDLLIGQTVLVSSTTDLRTAEFVGRVRKAPTSSILYVNETSEPILDNWYITVLNDFRLWDRLARQVSGAQRKDYELTFTTPAPLIYGLQSAYADVCSGSPEVLTIAFAPSALSVASGLTINGATWVWTIPSGGTITVGSSATQNITVAFDAGFKDWITVQVSDSAGNTGYFHFFVGAVPSDFSSVVTLTCKGISIADEGNGWDGSVEAFAGVDTLIDNTLVVAFSVEHYNGTKTHINGAVNFVGRIRTEDNNTVADSLYSQIKRVTYDLEGALAQFSRVEHLPFTLTNTAGTPTAFDQIKNMTMWRAIAYTLIWHTTYCTIFSLQFDSTDDTFLYLALPTQGGNILSVIQDLAVSINANIESAPTGETKIARDGVYLTGAQRAALTTILNGVTKDFINIDSLPLDEVDTTGKIQGSGGFYNTTSGKVTPLLSLAPGMAQGIGEGITTFARQVLAANATQANAQSELNTRTGHEYAAKRRAGGLLNLSLPPGYHFLMPSRSQWYSWTLAASDTTGGRAYTTDDRWQLTRVSIAWNNDIGFPTVSATWNLETSGTPGQTVVYPPQTTIPPALPTIPPLPPFPNFPPPPDIYLPPVPTTDDAPANTGIPTSNGNLVASWSASQEWIAPDVFLTNNPSWAEITHQASLVITDMQWVRLGSKGLYALGNDGTDSYFGYTADGTSPGAVWIITTITGRIYSKIRVGSTAGQVYIQGQSDSTACTGWTDLQFGTTFDGEFSGKQRFSSGAVGEGVGDGFARIGIVFAVDDCCNFISADLVSGNTTTQLWINCGDPIEAGYLNETTAWPFPLNVDYIAAKALGITFTVDLELTSTGGSVVTRYSSDFGATFAAERTVGDPP